MKAKIVASTLVCVVLVWLAFFVRSRWAPPSSAPRNVAGRLASVKLPPENKLQQDEPIPDGNYVMGVEHDSRNMLTRRNVVVGPDTEPLDLLLDNSTIGGQVHDAAGRPLANVRVMVESPERGYTNWNDAGIVHETADGGLSWYWHQDQLYTMRTDGDGRFHFRGCATGVSLSLRVAGEFWLRTRRDVVPLAPGEQRAGVDLEVAPAGCLRLSPTECRT